MSESNRSYDKCHWGEECPRAAIAHGLGRSNTALCAVHLPEYIRLLQRDLTETAGDLHKALSVIASVIPILADKGK